MTSPALKNKVKSSGSVNFCRALLVATLALTGSACAETPAKQTEASGAFPIVRIETTEGNMTVRLRPDVAPKTVENFLEYVRSDFYEGTVFHRVIPGFMIQGGGYTANLSGKPTRTQVENEAKRTFGNVRGSIAMARRNDPDSATSQFFINLVDNEFLDEGVRGPGYTVFGTVTEGMGVADAIANIPTTRKGGMADVPSEAVVIQSIEIIENGDTAQP